MRVAARLGACAVVGCCTVTPAQDRVVAAEPARGELGDQWDIDEGRSVGLVRDGETVWRLHLDPEKPHTYFHPLALPGVGELTVDSPGDHVHHHGLWFSWKYINGVNFWEHAPGTGRPAGRTDWTPTHSWLAPNGGSARFGLDVTYSIGGTVVLREARTIEVSEVAADGSYEVDWSSEFEAVAEKVTLDRTPLPGEPGGRVFGGYAGLSLRLVQLGDRVAVTLDGQADFNDDSRFRGRSGAFEYSGTLGGEKVGVAILTHPDNLNDPSPWYAIRTGVMSFFTPAVICDGPHEMEAGERFGLRYRVVVHRGRWGAEELAAARDAYLAELGENSAIQDDAIKHDESGDGEE